MPTQKPCNQSWGYVVEGGNDFWKKWVLSLVWNSERVMDGESGEEEEEEETDAGS